MSLMPALGMTPRALNLEFLLMLSRTLARAIKLASEKAAKELHPPAAAQPRSLPGGIASVADSIVGYEVNMDDYTRGGKSSADAERDREVDREEEVKAWLD